MCAEKTVEATLPKTKLLLNGEQVGGNYETKDHKTKYSLLCVIAFHSDEYK